MDRYFQTIRPLRKVGKLRGSLDLPVFEQQVTPAHGCIQCTKVSLANSIFASGAGLNDVSSLSVEFWWKLQSQNTSFVRCYNSLGTLIPWSVQVVGGYLTVVFTVFSGAQVIDNIQVPYNEWFHFCFTYDSVGGIHVYINGQEVSEGYAGEGNLTVVPNKIYLGTNTEAQASCRFAEMRIWNVVRTPEEVAYYYNRLVGTATTGLVSYWRFNEVAGSATAEDIATNGYDFTLSVGYDFIDDYPDLDIKLGISFVIGEFTFATGRNISLKFPVVKPYDEVNFMPVIRWTDEDDNVFRYKLWAVDGVDMTPLPADYNGERIPNGAVIEIWNIDGEENVELTEAITFITSLLTTVTSYITTGNPSSGSLGSLNTAIFSALPAAIPINFDQNYIP